MERDKPRDAAYAVMQNVGEADCVARLRPWGLGARSDLKPRGAYRESGDQGAFDRAEKADDFTARFRHGKGRVIPRRRDQCV